MKNSLTIISIFSFSFVLALLCVPAFGQPVAVAIGATSFAAAFVPMPTGVLGMNTQAARMVFENAKASLSAAFPGQDVRRFKLTQSYLRLELALSTQITRYQFQMLNQTAGSQFNTEQRLNLQDSFVISSLGVFLGKPSGANDSSFELDTYADSVKYTNAAAMNAIYNSKLEVTVNNDVIVPAWDVMRHFYRPQTQTTAATNSPLNQKRLAEDSFYAVEPNITAVGSNNTVITINMPSALSAVDANSRVIVYLRGILAQNSSALS